jgi:hypothetical protein
MVSENTGMYAPAIFQNSNIYRDERGQSLLLGGGGTIQPVPAIIVALHCPHARFQNIVKCAEI